MHPAALLSRHWPFANGYGRIIDRWCSQIDTGKGPIQARTGDRFPMTVLADDHNGQHIILSGRLDHSLVQVLLDQSRPGDRLLDVGANVGYFAGCFLTGQQ